MLAELVTAPVEGILPEVARHRAAVAERLQLEHREIELPTVEGYEATAEFLHTLPELSDQLLLAVLALGEAFDGLQKIIRRDRADRDRDRNVKRQREEIACRVLPRARAEAFRRPLHRRDRGRGTGFR